MVFACVRVHRGWVGLTPTTSHNQLSIVVYEDKLVRQVGTKAAYRIGGDVAGALRPGYFLV